MSTIAMTRPQRVLIALVVLFLLDLYEPTIRRHIAIVEAGITANICRLQ